MISHLSDELTQKYGKGFGDRTVRYLRKFARYYTPAALNPQLSWSHYRVLLTISNADDRLKLENLAILEKLTKKELQERTTALRKKTPLFSNEFSLIPRNAFPNIYKITSILSMPDCCMIDLGFHVVRQMSVPGISNPTAGMYITPSSAHRLSIQPGGR